MPVFYVYEFRRDGQPFLIYAASEAEARQKYKEWFGKEPGELIERKPW